MTCEIVSVIAFATRHESKLVIRRKCHRKLGRKWSNWSGYHG